MALRPSHRPRGFTLIELMVVLVVIAVMAGLLIIGSGDNPGRQLRREASTLASLLNLAADEAVMQGVELGLVIDGESYHFVRFDPARQRWQAIEGRPLAQYRFEREYDIAFELDGERIDERQRARIQQLAQRGEEADRPLLLLLSSGETTAFSLTLTDSESAAQVVLRSDGVNPVIVARPGEET
jgi:general secretion pathway protein H